MKKLTVLLLALIILVSCSACNKDKNEEGASTFNPQNADQSGGTPEGVDNPDAWWQQYTTKPSGKGENPYVNSQTPSKKSDSPTKKGGSKVENTTKKTSGGSSGGSSPSDEPNYTKVDADTMKYDVSNGKDNGVTTLTKSASNSHIKQALEAVNSYFGTNYAAKDTMCYSSTLPNMKSTNIVFIFGGSKKTKDSLLYVVRFESNEKVAFVTLTTDEDKAPLYFWPCASSGSEEYNAYRETFKTAVETNASGTFDKGTAVYKSLFEDENVQEFLKW